VGSTTDLEGRVDQHQEGEGGWTHSRGPWEIVHFEKFATLAEASRRGRNLKRGRVSKELRERLSRIR